MGKCDMPHIQRAKAAAVSVEWHGERKLRLMERIDLSNFQPSCFLAHDLVNKLSVIIGYCDLMKEIAATDPVCEKRLLIVSDLAKRMARELQDHQCQVELAMGKGLVKRPAAGEQLESAAQHRA
jgi:hypothetical protein